MNYFQITALLSAITSGFVCFFIIFNNIKSKTNRSFVYYAFFVFLWSGIYFLWLSSTSQKDSLFLMRLSNLSAIFIPSTFLHFTCHLINVYEKHKNIIKILYVFGVLMIPVAFTKHFIEDNPSRMMFTYWPHAGIAHYLLLIEYIGVITYSLYIIFKKSTETRGSQHHQLKFIFWGILLAYLGGGTNFPLCYDIPIPPYGNILVPAYTIFITWAIYKYQLMDISIVIKRSLVYTLLISIISLFYLILIYFTEHIVQSYFGYKSLLISIGSATVIALAFTPLKNLIQNFIEKTFFKGSYTQISEENDLLRQEVTQKERLKTVAILASGMAHEIKNPLTVIKTFTEYLPSKINDKEFIANFLPRVTQEVNRIDNLVHELLEYAKPASPVLKPVNIHELITNTTELLSNEYLKKKITTNSHFNAPLSIMLMIDYNQIKQALLNILLNAIESMPYGGQLNISSSLNHQQSKFNIKIQDTGVGIDPKDIDHIFDPFFSKKDNGTGLGLSITHEIIQNHQGKIYVESVKNSGTIFIIELPTTLPS